MEQVQVDFNSVDEEGSLRARLSRASSADLVEGQVVLATDHDGNRARATVRAVQPGGALVLGVDYSSWEDAE